jgi:putative ABC transport system permease protein
MQYADEQATKNQIAFFSILAIGITCLGLLGMISNKIVEKTKEIGIRKVMGARMYQIAQLLLNTTIRQIVVANIIGIPIAYYLVERYFEKFSDHVTLQWWHYVLPACVLIIIMLATITSELLKAARNNPVEALKYE